MKPKQETIQQITKCLNEFNDMLKKDKHTDYVKIKQTTFNNNCDTCLFYYAAELGIFKKQKRGVYENTLNCIEPFVSRRVYAHMRKRKNANRKQLSMPIIHEPAYGQMKNAIEKQKEKEKVEANKIPLTKPVKKRLKTFSLFWGLIKFNY
jgi:hypothetical protein